MSERTVKATIHEWSTCFASPDPYKPPEVRGIKIQGKAYDCAGHPDGEGICTSLVVSVDGRLVTTASGSVYKLGRIEPKFRAWLRKEGRAYDPANPIVIRGRK